MARNPQLFNITLVDHEIYNRYFEAILGYWLTNANQSVTSSDYKTYGGLLGGSMDPTDPSTEPNYQGEAVYAYEGRFVVESIWINAELMASERNPEPAHKHKQTKINPKHT